MSSRLASRLLLVDDETLTVNFKYTFDVPVMLRFDVVLVVVAVGMLLSVSNVV